MDRFCKLNNTDLRERFIKMKIARICEKTVVLVITAILCCGLTSPALSRGPDMHLCQIVAGEMVAEAVRGRLVETRAAEGRCVYVVALPEGVANATFVIYRHEARDYGELRDAQDGEVTRLDGLGDEAVLSFDPETKRYWLLVLQRDLGTLQISGDDKELVRQVAATALQQLAGQ